MQRHAATGIAAESSRVSTGTVGKMPRRSSARIPHAGRAQMYSVAGRSPGCFSSDAVRISRPRSRKCTRDCRCARLGTETSSSPPWPQNPEELGERARLIFERQVLEHVEAQRAIEAAVRDTEAPSAIRSSPASDE